MAETMPGVVNYGPEEGAAELREVPIPQIGDDDVLLAVRAVGVCGQETASHRGGSRHCTRPPQRVAGPDRVAACDPPVRFSAAPREANSERLRVRRR